MKNLTSIQLFSMLANTWRIASWPHTQHYFLGVSAKRVHLRTPVQSVVITNAVAPAELTPKQVTIKPVVTAFLLVSALKTAGSQVINVKLTNNTMVKDTVISAASIQSTSSSIFKAASATQQKLSWCRAPAWPMQTCAKDCTLPT
ncbi:zinc finger protein 532-like [Camelus bactrianus]|uniref:Zinc finger protein 532-like n=1 Tax=Camelus bactrianus TaxID=9837 RepID=A0AC58R7N1_CAMBA